MKNILAGLLLCVTVISASCKEEEAAIPVAGVAINKTALALIEGAKETLTATVLPDNATDKRLTWSSNNTSVATVSANGEVVAIKVGTATITMVSVDNKNKTAICEVTVTAPVVAVTGVTLSKQTLSLLTGVKETLTATVLPDNATDKTVTWESSAPAVASVSASGEIAAIAAGNATITATSVSDHSKTATCEVTVTKPIVAVTLIGINNKPLSLLVGAKETLLVTVLPDDATDKSVTWTSGDTSVATVSASGEVVAVGTGVATIKAVSVSDNTKTDECVVTVTAPVVTTTAIGNFYYSDKTQTKIYDKTKSCLGIVFWVDPADNQKGKIVSLDETELEWSTKAESTGAANNSNGRANMYQINVFLIASRNSVWEDYPAFNWVARAKNGRAVGGWADSDRWYLPAQGDLVALFASDGAIMTAVNESLNSISGAVKLTPGFYWTSTEIDDQSGFSVSSASGIPQSLIKYSASKVRAVAAF